MGELPSGTVTFCFTDIEGSTQLFAKLGPRFLDLLEEHRRIIRVAVAAHGGAEVKTEGDGFFLAFGDAAKAVAACIQFQRELGSHPWPEHAAIKVRAGLHVGVAQPTDNDYMTYEVHEAARVSAAAHGGQTVVTDTLRALVERGLPTDVKLTDLGTHELKDVGEIRLHQLSHPELEDTFPPLRTTGASRGYVPAPTSSLVGRDDDIGDLAARIDDTRLITITGSGGVGKTRLAVEVARGQLGRWSDGVWFIDLSPLTEDGWIEDTCLTALGVIRDAALDARTQLLTYLRGRRALLVIDNCEHMIAACTDLVDELLSACPDVSVVATSREALGLAGEIAWRADSLTLEQCRQLFTERARAVRPDLSFDDEACTYIDQIVERLDGIPLAIELAAARTTVLGVQQIAERLADRFKLLTGGSRTALARQRTLEATVDWSYRLLADEEQALVRRCSVFSGTFDLAAAEDVGGDDVLDTLQRLVEKSMVTATLIGGNVRYRMLETIRHFCWTKLLDADEVEPARDSHLDHYAHMAETISPGLEDARENAAATALSLDYDNLRAALEWSASANRVDGALRLITNLWMFWSIVGKTAEGLDWMDRILPTVSDGEPEALANARVGFAHLAWIAQRDAEDVLSNARAALHHAEQRGSSRSYDAWALHLVVMVNAGIDLSGAEEIDRAVDIARETGADFILTNCLIAQAAKRSDLMAFGESRASLDEAVDVASRSGSMSARAAALEQKAELLNKIGDLDEAVALAEEAVAAARRGSNVYFVIFALLSLARCKLIRRDDDADAPAEEALTIARDHGFELQTALALMERGWWKMSRREPSAAREAFEEAIAILERLAPHRIVMFFLLQLARAGFAEVAASEGALDEAAERLAGPNEIALSSGIPQLAAVAYNAQGWLAQLRGDLERAEQHHRLALEATLDGLHRLYAERLICAAAVRGLACIAYARGEIDAAVRLSGAAHRERDGVIFAPRLGMLMHDEMLEAARAKLGASFDDRWNEGAALGLDGVTKELVPS